MTEEIQHFTKQFSKQHAEHFHYRAHFTEEWKQIAERQNLPNYVTDNGKLDKSIDNSNFLAADVHYLQCVIFKQQA